MPCTPGHMPDPPLSRGRSRRRLALSGEPRLLDDRFDRAERRREFVRGDVAPDWDNDGKARFQRLTDHLGDSEPEARRPLIRKLDLECHRPHLPWADEKRRPGCNTRLPALF